MNKLLGHAVVFIMIHTSCRTAIFVNRVYTVRYTGRGASSQIVFFNDFTLLRKYSIFQLFISFFWFNAGTLRKKTFFETRKKNPKKYGH